MALSSRWLAAFARLLSYPCGDLVGDGVALGKILAETSPEAAHALAPFVRFVQQTPMERVEEIYTGAFDLNASSPPYLGYYLFGESYKRSVFMLALQERYRASNIEPGAELADHLTLVLRWLATLDDEEQRLDLVCDALLPALERMLRKADEEEAEVPGENVATPPYRAALDALRIALRSEVPAGRTIGAAPTALPLAPEEVSSCPSTSCSLSSPT